MIPVTLLTGFLGAGKTTVLNRLLRHPGLADCAVLVNEFGEIGIDHLLLERLDQETVLLNAGCLCCTIRGDLVRALERLDARVASGRPLRRVVIETTGLADPAPILQTLMTDPVIEHEFRLDGVVTVVDAVNGATTLDAQVEAVKQAAVADRLVLTKTDLADPAAVAGLKARLRALNPAAPILHASQGAVPPARLLDAGPYDTHAKSPDVERWLAVEAHEGAHDDDHHHHGDHADAHEHGQNPHDPNRHDARIRAFAIRRKEPLAAGAVSLFLELLTAQRGADLLRVKGILNVADTPERPLVIHAVQHVVHAPVTLDRWPSADRDTRLVLITRDLAPGTIEALLDALTTVDAAGLLPTGGEPAAADTMTRR